MSVEDASVGHGRIKMGLRGKKLTCPQLLGKSKTKDDPEHVGGIQAWQPGGLKDSSKTMEASMPSCRENSSEELELTSTTSNPQRHSEENKERKEARVTSENQLMATKSLPLDQSEVVADQPGHKRMTQKRSGLKQIFSRSLICLACLRKPVERGDHDDGGERCAVMFFNRQTRDSLDLTSQSAVVRDVSVAEEQVHGSSGHQCPVEERGTIKVKSLSLYKRLIMAPKDHSKAKTVGPDNFPKGDTPHAVCSVKKPPWADWPFWRHRAKKPSPFFQERIGGGTQEYIKEETIVLANKHADCPTAETMSLCPYLATEDKGHCPDRLTVSVDVSAVSAVVKEATEITSEDTKASEAPSHLEKDIKVMIEEPKGNLEETPIEGERIQMNLSSLEKPSGPLNNVASQCSEVVDSLEIQHRQQGINEYITLTVCVASSGHPTAGEKIRTHVTYSSDSNTVCQDSSAHIGTDPAPGSILGSIMANDEIMEDLHLNPFNDVQSCNTEPSPFLNNVPDTSYCGMGHSEENGKREFDQREMVLLETACSVVQVAINAALDQFSHELESVASMDQ